MKIDQRTLTVTIQLNETNLSRMIDPGKAIRELCEQLAGDLTEAYYQKHPDHRPIDLPGLRAN